MRGILFLLSGVVGGTLLVGLISFVVHDWSYLSRWIGGLVALTLVAGLLAGKQWLKRRVVNIVKLQTDDGSYTQPDPASLLNAAAQLEGTDRVRAIAIYEDIVRFFPNTPASREAARNIQTLKKQN
jgi:hypothetical protein